MSVITRSPLPGAPALRDRRPAMRVLVAVGREDDTGHAIGELHVLEQSHACSVTIVAVALPSLFVRSFAPLSGMTTVERLVEMAGDGARRLARTLAAASPAGGVDRIVTAATWDAPALIDPVRTGSFDAIVLARLPRNWRARRRLLAAACASDTDLIVAARP
jgi:hypothetical protein